ncbi:MAG: viroplasmin family protein [Bacteroidales bacterium]
MKKKRFYVVWKGAETGIFTSWQECFKRVKGYAGARYMAFETEEEARQAFSSSPDEWIGKRAKPIIHNVAIENADRKPILPSLSVDASCSGSPGRMEYRGVDTATGQEIFRQGPLEEATNNIGEFLAIVHALAYLGQQGSAIPVYSDSRIALLWVKQGKAKTQLKPSPTNARVFELIGRAEKWLATHHYSNPLLKWETRLWGEIPADFGRK